MIGAVSSSDAPSTLPAATSIWRRIPISWIVVALLVFGGSIAGFFVNAGRSDTGEISKSGDMQAKDLQVGDCFDLKDPAADQVEDVTAKPCADAHQYELFFVGSPTGAEYPSEDKFLAFVDASCVPAFGDYVGRSYADSELDIFWLYPQSDAWSQGDHTVQCAVYHPRISELTESLKGAKQ